MVPHVLFPFTLSFFSGKKIGVRRTGCLSQEGGVREVCNGSYNRNRAGHVKNPLLAVSLYLKANSVMTRASKRGKQSRMCVSFLNSLPQCRKEENDWTLLLLQVEVLRTHTLDPRQVKRRALVRQEVALLEPAVFSDSSHLVLHAGEIFHPWPIRFYSCPCIYTNQKQQHRSRIYNDNFIYLLQNNEVTWQHPEQGEYINVMRTFLLTKAWAAEPADIARSSWRL